MNKPVATLALVTEEDSPQFARAIYDHNDIPRAHDALIDWLQQQYGTIQSLRSYEGDATDPFVFMTHMQCLGMALCARNIPLNLVFFRNQP